MMRNAWDSGHRGPAAARVRSLCTSLYLRSRLCHAADAGPTHDSTMLAAVDDDTLLAILSHLPYRAILGARLVRTALPPLSGPRHRRTARRPAGGLRRSRVRPCSGVAS
jgi:hypothetical protein